jgi:1,4-alpha-glucan branching enzyme
VADLNRLYRSEAALHGLEFDPRGFAWIDCHDKDQSIVTSLRRGPAEDDRVVCVFNFTPVPRPGYRIGLPTGGAWSEALNSDAAVYAGSGMGNCGQVLAEPMAWHGRPFSAAIVLPRLG